MAKSARAMRSQLKKSDHRLLLWFKTNVEFVQVETNADAQAELATAIDDLLDTVGSKFQTQSKDILKQSKWASLRYLKLSQIACLPPHIPSSDPLGSAVRIVADQIRSGSNGRSPRRSRGPSKSQLTNEFEP
jgi:hypothetical protein